MTLEEKASLCSGLDFWHLKGIPRLGIPSIMVTDGPHGLRKQSGDASLASLNQSIPATCFPTASALAASWDRDLVFQVGQALGKECRQEKVGVILGPGANIKRSPLCGRNFEYFSEDPFLSGEIARSHISGIQSQGIGASLKHFTVNNHERRRMVINAVVDERALREIYLAGFEIAVKGAQPWTVMGAYNKVNGTYCCENYHLLTDILKGEWDHQGLVVTDWGAMNQRVEALIAGCELEMPGTKSGNEQLIVDAVQEGHLDEDILDQSIERILAIIFKATETLTEDYSYDQQTHHALARRVAGDCAALLKNESDILPLEKSTKVALCGGFAKYPRYQGAGSSSMNPTQLDSIYDEVTSLIGTENIDYAQGYPLIGDVVDHSLIKEALDTVRSAEVVVICAGLSELHEVEGLDRQHLRLPPTHDALIQAVAAVHPKVVVVLSNGAPVEMPWINEVEAILEAYLAGQAGGGAVADILYGLVNPSGKLAETFPIHLEDNPSHPYFPGGQDAVEYHESIYVGYRYYDTAAVDVLFPFGHGLSYTAFQYSDLQLSHDSIHENDTLTVSLQVRNTGHVAGKEVVQLYIRDVESTAFRPHKELKGFAKVDLQPDETSKITFALDRRAFAYYNPEIADWHVESGEFQLLVGASSQDIRLSAAIHVQSAESRILPTTHDAINEYYNLKPGASFSQAGFESLLGRTVPTTSIHSGKPYTLNTPIGDMTVSFAGRLFGKIMRWQMRSMIKNHKDTPNALFMEAMAHEAPLRLLLMAGDGSITRPMLEALLDIINGKFFKGITALITSIRNRP
jgi:beta-glucosidase